MLLLPSRHGSDAACARALKTFLSASGIAPADFSGWLSLQLEQWRTTGSPTEMLRNAVKKVITASYANGDHHVHSYGPRLAENYFSVHKRLVDDHLLSHSEAVALLCHAFLIAHLASREKLSAAQVSHLISKRDPNAKISRQTVECLLQSIQMSPSLSARKVEALYKRDRGQEIAFFADADLLAAASLVASYAERLGYRGDLIGSLKTLSLREDADGLVSPYTAYLQILHYQCSIAEFFDHAVTDIYEFSPRGQIGTWLHKQYPDAIAGAGNPFLNNAKSVEVLDGGWVRAKKGKERPGAQALLSVLEGLQEMAFPARRELAWALRLWLHRLVKLAEENTIEIPRSLSSSQIETLFCHVSKRNTTTFGILEQRSVDAVAVCRHSGWRQRGLGDSVNATNLSRSKLGDCEFIDPSNRALVAYESHAGRLTRWYVEDHLATIEKSIRKRVGELEAIADLSDWSAKIVFVAHELDEDLRANAWVAGLDIAIEYVTFNPFLNSPEILSSAYLSEAVSRFLLAPIQEQRTPSEVRKILLDLI